MQELIDLEMNMPLVCVMSNTRQCGAISDYKNVDGDRKVAKVAFAVHGHAFDCHFPAFQLNPWLRP